MKKIISVLLVTLLLTACGAKKEDEQKLVVYSPNSEGMINAVIPLFENKEGVKVELISAGTGELIKRIESEKANPYGDVLFGGTYTQFLSNKDLFMDYVSTEDTNVVDEYKNDTGFITYNVLDGSVLVVNKELTEDLTIESYEDLLQPELKGKIATADPANSSSAFAQLTNILLAMSPDKDYMNDEAWDYVEKLVKQWDGKIQSGSSSVYKSVVDGEMWVGLTYEDPVSKLIQDGAKNIEIVYPKEGSVFLPAGAGIIKGTKNEENAKKFMDFILSEEVQTIFGSDLTNRPVRKDVKTGDHLKDYSTLPLIFEDMEYVTEHKEDIVKRYTELFAKLQN
ncbi:ABC transporter substrate-binding protein [Erysipelothrix urinaevulpis]|uniref:ABC transporter substrate-binding protein n=1 Tax=Erysipelothrix urinaevulpis TaxID=2683717 RepID=UPI0013571F36|nr:ABC transporter substrate-binding protein [Erysipelothrix urinaevulpis]